MARSTVEVKKLVEKANSYKGFMFLNNDDSEINTFGYVTRKYFI